MADRRSTGPVDAEELVTSDPVAFARAVEELPVGVIVHQGPDHVVLGANRTARAFWGHRPGILGRPLREVVPEFAGQYIIELLDRVYTTGEAFTVTEWRVVVNVHGSGDEHIVNGHVTPLHEADGQVSGIVCQFVDITEEVLRRRALEDDTAALRERCEAAQSIVLTLQRSLLPGRLPVLPGFRIAARYLVASEEQSAGGDWFDAIPLVGRVCAVVGDVVGHGADASAVMGQLRAVLTEFLLDGSSTASNGDELLGALARLDRFATRTPRARGATVSLALIDPKDGSLAYVCAGHPPPLVLSADGAARFLPAPGGGPLGVAGPAPVVGRAALRPGDLLLCFSDGLVEHPGEDLSIGLAELAKVASAALLRGPLSLRSADPADRVTELTVDRMTRQGYQDDVTLLVVRLTGQDADEFVADLPAEPGQLSMLRDRLGAWLDEAGASAADIAAIESAVLEAVTNAVEHAYDGSGGRVQVEGLIDGSGRACMTVIDQGVWRPADVEPGNRGRGLTMMRGCMDSVEIESSAVGTTLLLDRQLSHTPVLGLARPGQHLTKPDRPSTLTVTVTRSEEPRVTLGGPIDISTVGDLRRQLWSANRGGALPLTIELGDVTHLASAGIQMLFELVEEMTADGRKLAFVAPPDCPARYALSLSNLDQVVPVADG